MTLCKISLVGPLRVLNAWETHYLCQTFFECLRWFSHGRYVYRVPIYTFLIYFITCHKLSDWRHGLVPSKFCEQNLGRRKHVTSFDLAANCLNHSSYLVGRGRHFQRHGQRKILDLWQYTANTIWDRTLMVSNICGIHPKERRQK